MAPASESTECRQGLTNLMSINYERLQARLERARSAKGHGITYGLGKGGFDPADNLPDQNGKCDCSGFVSWCLGMSRQQGNKNKPWSKQIPWIETTAVHKDATGKQLVFKAIPKPVAGCLVVFPDSNGKEGHIGVVAIAGAQYTVVDCTSKGITEHPGTYFRGKKSTVFCILKEDEE